MEVKQGFGVGASVLQVNDEFYAVIHDLPVTSPRDVMDKIRGVSNAGFKTKREAMDEGSRMLMLIQEAAKAHGFETEPMFPGKAYEC